MESNILPILRLLFTWQWPFTVLWKPRIPKTSSPQQTIRRAPDATHAVHRMPSDNLATLRKRVEQYQSLPAGRLRCTYCRRLIPSIVTVYGHPVTLELHWDHRIPVSAGGETKGNLYPACHLCNLWKSDRPFTTEAELRDYLEDQWTIHLAPVNTAEESFPSGNIGEAESNDSAPANATSPNGAAKKRPRRRKPEEFTPTLFVPPPRPRPEPRVATPRVPVADHWATCNRPFVTLEQLAVGDRFEFYAYPGQIVTLVEKTMGRAIVTPHLGETSCALGAQVCPVTASDTPPRQRPAV